MTTTATTTRTTRTTRTLGAATAVTAVAALMTLAPGAGAEPASSVAGTDAVEDVRSRVRAGAPAPTRLLRRAVATTDLEQVAVAADEAARLLTVRVRVADLARLDGEQTFAVALTSPRVGAEDPSGVEPPSQNAVVEVTLGERGADTVRTLRGEAADGQVRQAFENGPCRAATTTSSARTDRVTVTVPFDCLAFDGQVTPDAVLGEARVRVSSAFAGGGVRTRDRYRPGGVLDLGSGIGGADRPGTPVPEQPTEVSPQDEAASVIEFTVQDRSRPSVSGVTPRTDAQRAAAQRARDGADLLSAAYRVDREAGTLSGVVALVDVLDRPGALYVLRFDDLDGGTDRPTGRPSVYPSADVVLEPGAPAPRVRWFRIDTEHGVRGFDRSCGDLTFDRAADTIAFTVPFSCFSSPVDATGAPSFTEGSTSFDAEVTTSAGSASFTAFDSTGSTRVLPLRPVPAA